ncbi:MAG: class I SAM-dependent methyltransferase [Terriglobia bacterium]
MSAEGKDVTSFKADDWDHHWSEYSQTAERNPAQNYRREVIFSLLGPHHAGEGMRLLDIGSGQGDMARAVQTRFPSAEIFGLELSRSGVEIARRKVPTARFLQCNLLETVTLPKHFVGWATHAICSEVIEHVDDPCALLKNARPYMSNGCRLVLTAPGGPMSAFDKHIGHRRHWQREDIENLLRDAEYIPEHITGVGFPFFNLYRCVIILRGEKLILDARTGTSGAISPLARAVMGLFNRLIRRRLNSSRFGWQMIGTARLPDSQF